MLTSTSTQKWNFRLVFYLLCSANLPGNAEFHIIQLQATIFPSAHLNLLLTLTHTHNHSEFTNENQTEIVEKMWNILTKNKLAFCSSWNCRLRLCVLSVRNVHRNDNAHNRNATNKWKTMETKTKWRKSKTTTEWKAAGRRDESCQMRTNIQREKRTCRRVKKRGMNDWLLVIFHS